MANKYAVTNAIERGKVQAIDGIGTGVDSLARAADTEGVASMIDKGAFNIMGAIDDHRAAVKELSESVSMSLDGVSLSVDNLIRDVSDDVWQNIGRQIAIGFVKQMQGGADEAK